jgi:hypothetical protein
VVAFCLNAFSTALYRILEGYLLWPGWLQRRGADTQRKRKKSLEDATSGASGWQRGLALEKLALYPQRDEQIVPTRFGNALRSFEIYGKTRYNLDSQTLWYELYAGAPKYLQGEIKEARSSVDFFVALIYLNAALSLVCFATAALQRLDLAILTVGIAALAVAFFCHWLAVRATAEWGYTVQALVNIGRVKLAESMGLQLPKRLEDEKTLWGLVTKYFFYARPADGAELDRFRKSKPANDEEAAKKKPEAADDEAEKDGEEPEDENGDEKD